MCDTKQVVCDTMPRPDVDRVKVDLRVKRSALVVVDRLAGELGVSRSEMLRRLLAAGLTDALGDLPSGA